MPIREARGVTHSDSRTSMFAHHERRVAELEPAVLAELAEAARAVGNPEWKVAFRHVLPNSLIPSLIQVSSTIGFAILLTSSC